MAKVEVEVEKHEGVETNKEIQGSLLHHILISLIIIIIVLGHKHTKFSNSLFMKKNMVIVPFSILLLYLFIHLRNVGHSWNFPNHRHHQYHQHHSHFVMNFALKNNVDVNGLLKL